MKKNICFLSLFFLPLFLLSQLPAGTTLQKDSTNLPDTTLRADSTVNQLLQVPAPTAADLYNTSMNWMLENNFLLNSKALPAPVASKARAVQGTDVLFYCLVGVTLLLAFLRFFYTRYFNSMFQVFFNTSLRQSQLTDQLLQARLIAAFFNLFFVLTGGLYIFSLIRYYQVGLQINTPLLIIACVIVLTVVYFVKFCVLKFTGWLTGFKEVANTYLFVIFLINKIISILLLPFIVVITFSVSGVRLSAVVVSLLLVGFMFFLRFIRSYGLLRNKLKVGWFHFLIFLAGVELLPLLLIYKGVVILLPKNL